MYRTSRAIEESVPSKVFPLITMSPLMNISRAENILFPNASYLYIVFVVLSLQRYILFFSLVSLFFFKFLISN